MDATDPIRANARGFSIRLPRPQWILLATVALAIGAWSLAAWEQAAAVAVIRRHEGALGYASNCSIHEGVVVFHVDFARYAAILGPTDEPESGDGWAFLKSSIHRPFIADRWDYPLGVEIRERSLNLGAVDSIGRLRHLQYLEVHECQFDGQAFGRSLQKLHSLRWLILYHSSVDDEVLLAAAGMPHLEWLELSNTDVTDEGLAALMNLRKLRILRLSGTRVSDRGMASLMKLTELKELELDETDVTDAGLGCLENFVALERLELTQTRIPDAAIDDIVKARGLKRLWLRHTNISPDALAKLATLPELEVLVISGTGIKEDDLEIFREQRKSLGLPSVTLICEWWPV